MNEGQNGNGGGAGGGFASSGGGSDGFDALMNGGGNSGATVGGGTVNGSGMAANSGSAPAEQLVVNGVPISGVVNAPKTSNATSVGTNSGVASGFGVAPSMGITNGTPMNYVGPAGSGTGANVSAGGGMGYAGPAMSVSSGTGDITLSSGEEKKSKKGWIIGILVGAVVVSVIVVVMMLAPGLVKTKEKANVKFDSLVTYLEKGNDDNAIFSSESLLYAIAIYENNMDEINGYYEEVNKKKVDFLDSVVGVSNELLERYKGALKVMENIINYRAIEDKLIELYASSGVEVAKKYYEDKIQCESVGEGLKSLCIASQDYYDATVNEFALYYDAGCYNDELYDEACIKQRVGTIDIGQVSEYMEYAQRSFNRVQSDESKLLLNREIEGINREMKEALNNA